MSIIKYNQFITESSKNTLIDSIINVLEPKIDDMMYKIIEWELQENGHKISEFSKKIIRLNLIYDLVKAIECYTEKTDKLISINASNSIKGNIEIFAKIQRGDNIYNFTTEAIYAGGYNIQKLHYRYITKTNLPITRNQETTKTISEKIKKLTKTEKINNEIENYKNRIKNNDDNISKYSSYTDEEILYDLQNDNSRNTSWLKKWYNMKYEDLDKDSEASKKSKEEWEKDHSESIKKDIDFWKMKNITWKKSNNIELEKQIKKLYSKIDII